MYDLENQDTFLITVLLVSTNYGVHMDNLSVPTVYHIVGKFGGGGGGEFGESTLFEHLAKESLVN